MNKSDFLKTFLKQDIDNQCGTCRRGECVDYFSIPLTGKFSNEQQVLDCCIGVIIQYFKSSTNKQAPTTSQHLEGSSILNVSVLNVEFLQYKIIHTSIDSVRVDCQCNILTACCSSLKHLIEYKGRIVSVGQEVQDSVDVPFDSLNLVKTFHSGKNE